MKCPSVQLGFHVQFAIKNSKVNWTSPGDLQLDEKKQGHNTTFTLRFPAAHSSTQKYESV